MSGKQCVFRKASQAAALLLAVCVSHAASPPMTPDGFAVPRAGRQFIFPRDHGSHPEFKVEWWYVTGHLDAGKGRRFGFQATFFRRAGRPPGDGGPLDSPRFSSRELHLAHMALLDVESGKFLHQERLNRQGWDAFASTNGLDLRNGNWSLKMQPAPSETMQVEGTIHAAAGFSLALTPQKPLVVFGSNGVSRKAASPTAASHYLTYTRLAVTGRVDWLKQSLPVHGQAWMDHEISSSQLDENQSGWDWACVQWNDGRETMLYRMRRRDGSADPFSTVAWIDREGRVQHLDNSSFTWEPLEFWKSGVTQARYPVRHRLTVREPGRDQPRVFELAPLAIAQEMTGTLGGVPYWEGACRVLDAAGQESGSAYVELTGYAGNLGASFR